MLVLIYCFMYLPLFVGTMCLSLFCLVYIFGVLSRLAIILARKRELVSLLLF